MPMNTDIDRTLPPVCPSVPVVDPDSVSEYVKPDNHRYRWHTDVIQFANPPS